MAIEPRDSSDNQTHNQADEKSKKHQSLQQWPENNHPLRRLLVFQVKLAVDAFRDIALSPVAIVATLIDLLEGHKGKNRFFEKVMQFGRVSERNINLFDQRKSTGRTVDNVLDQLETVLVNEYKNGDLSAKAKAAIEKKLKLRTATKAQKEKPGEPG